MITQALLVQLAGDRRRELVGFIDARSAVIGKVFTRPDGDWVVVDIYKTYDEQYFKWGTPARWTIAESLRFM